MLIHELLMRKKIFYTICQFATLYLRFYFVNNDWIACFCDKGGHSETPDNKSRFIVLTHFVHFIIPQFWRRYEARHGREEMDLKFDLEWVKSIIFEIKIIWKLEGVQEVPSPSKTCFPFANNLALRTREKRCLNNCNN